MSEDLVKRLRGTLAEAARARFEAADRIKQLERELAAEKALADWFAEIVKNCTVTTGYCCCGDPIDSHGMDSGHSPVDYGAYQAEKALDAHRKARGL